MQNKAFYYIILIALFFVISFLCLWWFSDNYSETIRSKPKMYCYDTFSGPVNSALYIKNLKDSADFLQYYRKLSSGETPVGNFPLNGIDPNSPVYIQEYVNKDSSIVEIINYYQSPLKSRPFFLRCYVYSSTLHTFPPEKTK